MIESIEFKNFKVLRDAKLPLSRCNILVGPNGSGKSTVLRALELLSGQRSAHIEAVRSAGARPGPNFVVRIRANWRTPVGGQMYSMVWDTERQARLEPPDTPTHAEKTAADVFRRSIRVYSLEASAISAPVALTRDVELGHNGANLAGVLDRLRDTQPDRYGELKDAIPRWLPEFRDLSFDLEGSGQKVILLHMAEGNHKVRASDLSQGTLLALAVLTISYLPNPPSLIGLEEPDRGIHPRLLRHFQDALYRLCYPEKCGENRQPVQVIATTHSPYFLDLFREHPEEIVIANRVGENVQFERLSDRKDIREILGDAPLGEVWYSGILGGVPSEP